MTLFDSLPIGPPKTVHDFSAFRELHRHDLSGVEPKIIAILYGFSSLPEYRDEDCLQGIERWMDESSDPVQTRYELACNLGEFFDDEYFYFWKTVYLPEEHAGLDSNVSGAYGPVPHRRPIQPGEPGYVSEIPAELHDKVIGWLVEGIKRFRDDEKLFQHIRTIAARALAGDTFLDDNDIEQLRRASNDELTLRTDKWAQEAIKKIVKNVNEAQGLNEDGTPP
jgi:hypothetical protein